MIRDRVCSFCNTIPVKKVNRHPLVKVDKNGNIFAVEPIKMIDTVFYECSCGMRYMPQEVEG